MSLEPTNISEWTDTRTDDEECQFCQEKALEHGLPCFECFNAGRRTIDGHPIDTEDHQ